MSKFKPLDAGFKRNLIIIGGAIAICTVVILFLTMTGSNHEIQTAATTRLGTVIPSGDGQEPEISEHTREALNRVAAREAAEAREEGQTYIPPTSLGRPTRVEDPPPPPAPTFTPPPKPVPARSAAQRAHDRQSKSSNSDRETEALIKGLLSQVQGALSALEPATMESVAIMTVRNDEAGAVNAGAASLPAGAAGTGNANRLALTVTNDIYPAELQTPVNTDTTQFALVEITGGKLNGALMRGTVVPLALSGEVEDVGIHLHSMQFNGRSYKIDAMTLNEKTATDAMGGDVDRHIISRYVMPILMAGATGAATYFTAKGQTDTRLVTDGGGPNNSYVVDKTAPSNEQARNQAIGESINKAVSIGESVVNRSAARPNTISLQAFTPVGVIFNSPVYLDDGNQ